MIESIVMDLPIPVIYLSQNANGGYEVIDGVQRLTSVFDFFDNKFSLSGLQIRKDLNKTFFRDLDAVTCRKLEDSSIRSFELGAKTPQDLLFLIFERLNTGGVKLTEMEIRNCIYRGKLNDLVRVLAKLDDFRSVLNVRNLEKRMTDRAFVLRFLAFYYLNHNTASQGLKAFLNKFSESCRNPQDTLLMEFETKFKLAMRNSLTVFGSEGFRIRRSDARGGGEWAPKPNAAIFQVVATTLARFDHVQITQRRDAIFEEYLDILSNRAWVDAVTKSTGDQANIKLAFDEWGSRLENIMRSTSGLDSKRAFSLDLKSERFKSDPTCSICSQHIKTMNDAVLDHETHYWRGGQTIPSNARLSHRSCNLARGGN